LSRQDSTEEARQNIARHLAFAKDFGEGTEPFNKNGADFVLCDMGDDYDTVFQKDLVIGGVSSVKYRRLAIQMTTEFWWEISNK
jgi:hypothetical protein